MGYIQYMEEGHVATMTISRSEALNALNKEVLEELEIVMDRLEQDGKIKVAVFTGAGNKAFVAGADIAAMQGMSPVAAERFSQQGHRVFDRLETSAVFTIAAVNGFALGGGCELAMSCDMRVASENAKLGIPETTLGLIPGFGGTQRLPRLVGLGKAKELLATGIPVTAAAAKEMGLVNHVVKQENLLPFCYELAAKIVSNSQSAVRLGKQAMNAGLEMDQDKAMDYEAALFAVAFSTLDSEEGIKAFLEKRKASFQ